MSSAASSQPSSSLDKSNQRVREMFRQIAPRYDLMNHLLSMNIDKLWRSRVVKMLRIKDHSPILDVCTGTGDLAIAISKQAGTDTPVMATDFCFDMLEIGRQKQKKLNNENISFIEADTQHLPFEDDQFQVVTVAFGLRNVADTSLGLKEMIRVCKPGGQVVVLEFSQPTFPGLKQAYQFYFRKALPKIGQMLARNNKSAYEYLPESVGQFPCGQALTDLMSEAGLKETSFKPLTVGIATIYEGTK